MITNAFSMYSQISFIFGDHDEPDVQPLGK
jgi:hypothetical protein